MLETEKKLREEQLLLHSIGLLWQIASTYNFILPCKNRNSFFHDHKMTGLTISADNCLEAFCDLYDLLDILFPDAVKKNKTATYEAQTATIRVLKNCAGDDDKQKKFNKLMRNWENKEGKKNLKTKGEVKMEFPDRSYQYCVIHYSSQRFYDALKLEGLINP